MEENKVLITSKCLIKTLITTLISSTTHHKTWAADRRSLRPWRRSSAVAAPLIVLSERQNPPQQSDPAAPPPGVHTVKSTTTLRALDEIIHGEIRRRDSDGELQFVAVARDLDYVNPEEEDLHLNPAQVGDPVFGDRAGDGALVLEIVAADGEAAAAVERHREFAGGRVELVARDALGQKAGGEAVGLENFVDGGGIGGRGGGGDEGED